MNYIISIDLNKLHTKESNRNDSNLNDLVSEYNSIDSFDFKNSSDDMNQYLNDIIYKYKFDSESDQELILFDKFKLINTYYKNSDKFLLFNKGLILFDNSMVNDTELTDTINKLFSNYNELVLNKIYDNYILYFNEKANINSNKNINENLKQLFIEDLNELILWGKIKNIPNKINNRNLSKKLSFDLSYMGYVKSNIYQKFFHKNSNKLLTQEIQNYEKILINDLKSDNYSVSYSITNNEIDNVVVSNHSSALNQLNEYNTFITDIINKLDINKDINNLTNFDDMKLLKTVDINDLFNLHKLNDLYNYINKSNLIIKMGDVLDDKLTIYEKLSDKKNELTQVLFTNQIIVFINELLKQKIIKTIRTYNYMQNRINIENNN